MTSHASSSRGASFVDLLRDQGREVQLGGLQAPAAPTEFTHATTIVALRYADGVVMAGDRRATMGNVIAHRSMRKVFAADQWSAVSISGVAGTAEEMVKLFQLELEHYEKVEGVPLSLEGKATRLSQMVRSNLPMAMQAGLVVIPIFAGYDRRRQQGRIYNYDITGGKYEEVDFHGTGSGGTYARGVMKMRWSAQMSRDEAIELAVEALFEAAEEDSATGGPDAVRGIYPTVATISDAGYQDVPEADVASRFAAILDRRRRNAEASGNPSRLSTPGDLS